MSAVSPAGRVQRLAAGHGRRQPLRAGRRRAPGGGRRRRGGALGAGAATTSGRRAAWCCWALRIAGVLACLLTALEPTVELRQVTRVPNRVAVLVDTSRSMEVRPPDGGRSRAERAAALLDRAAPELAALQRDGHDVDLYGFGENLSPATAVSLHEPPAGGRHPHRRGAGRAARPLRRARPRRGGADLRRRRHRPDRRRAARRRPPAPRSTRSARRSTPSGWGRNRCAISPSPPCWPTSSPSCARRSPSRRSSGRPACPIARSR